MYIKPLLATHKVVCYIRMDNTHERIPDRVCIHALQLSRRTEYEVNIDLCRRVEIRSARYCCFCSAYNLGRVNNACAAGKLLSYDGIESASCLRAEKLRCLQNIVVDSRHVEHIRKLNPAAVLFDSSGDCAHIKRLSIGRDAFRQCRGCFCKRRILTHFDSLAGALGNGILVSELVVYELRLCVVKQPLLIVSFHLGGQIVAACRRSSCVYDRSKKLQVEYDIIVHFLYLLFLVQGDQKVILSPLATLRSISSR